MMSSLPSWRDRVDSRDAPMRAADRRHKADRLRFAVMVLLGGSIVLTVLLAPLVSVSLSAHGSGFMVANIAVMLVGAAVLRARHPGSPLGDIAQSLAVIMLAGLVCGAMAMLALRSGVPLADGQLRSFDASMGLSAQASVERLALLPASVLRVFHTVYETSFPQIAVAAMLLPLCRRSFECWRLVFVFAGGSLTSALISFGFPAMGSFVTATAATISAMPQGAGTYAFHDVAQFRSASHATLDLEALAGVITFPSVHTILALLAIQAWWWHPVLRWPVLALNLLVIVTTIPMGGHYFVDLLAGALIWLALSRIAERIATGKSTAQQSRLCAATA